LLLLVATNLHNSIAITVLPNLEVLKIIIRDTANEEIFPRFNRIDYNIKADGSIVTEADLAADRRIREALLSKYPDIDFLSEEMELEEQEDLLKTSKKLWILDPLDGTSNFASGLPLFATSLALIVDGKVQIGITYDVNKDEMFTAVKGKGAWLNDEPLKCKSSLFSLDKSIAIIDFKRLKPHLLKQLMNDRPYRSQRNIGASVLELVWMAANRGQLYLHGGMKIWDLAAGSLILSEAGGYSSTIEGDDVFKLTMKPQSVIISPDENLFKAWRNYVFKASNDEG